MASHPVTAPDGSIDSSVRHTRENVVSLSGSPEWRDWLHRLSEHCRANTTTMIDQAIVRHAHAVGFHEPPPRR